MRTGRIAGLAAAAAGIAVAGAAAGAVNHRHRAQRRRTGEADPYGTLRAEPTSVVTPDGVTLHVEVDEVEHADGPTLVFVHGYALNLDCWHFQRAAVRGVHRAVFYDLRSHGRSSRSGRDHATIEQLGEDLALVLEQVTGDEPVVLVGHSMGGMTVIALAEQHPELFGTKVVGVGLIGTTAGGLEPERVILPQLPRPLTGQLAPRVVALLAHGPNLVDGARRTGSDLGYWATRRFAFGGKVSPTLVDFVDAMLANTPFEVLAEFFPHFATLDKFAALSALAQVPTTIVCGTKDRLTRISHSRKMASQLDGARLVECEGAGHLVLLEQPDRVNQALEELYAASTRTADRAG